MRRNLLLILIAVLIVFQLLILINVVTIKLDIASMETPCGGYTRPCKVIVVPDR